MGRLTTHVLDTSLGRPGQGIRIEVYRLEGESRTLLKEVTTNDDGPWLSALSLTDLARAGIQHKAWPLTRPSPPPTSSPKLLC